jgi:hypothetical protein
MMARAEPERTQAATRALELPEQSHQHPALVPAPLFIVDVNGT